MAELLDFLGVDGWAGFPVFSVFLCRPGCVGDLQLRSARVSRQAGVEGGCVRTFVLKLPDLACLGQVNCMVVSRSPSVGSWPRGLPPPHALAG